MTTLPNPQLLEPLTPSERRVLELMNDGLSDKEIASEMGITPITVRGDYKQQIYDKLGLEKPYRNKKWALYYAYEFGLLGEKASLTAIEQLINHPIRPEYNLPTPTTAFIGRASEIDDVMQLIDEPSHRLITIIAPGGMGKTRLAIAVAEQYIDIFIDGVFFVPLQALSNPDSIVLRIASSVKFPLQSGDASEQILNFLANKQMLLVFDNFEHLLDGADILADILSNAPAIKILVTSRESLKLSAETVYTLASMDVPDETAWEQVWQSDAVKLFIESAQHTRPNWQLTDDNMKYVISICHMVDGMPLAILLATSWLDMMSVKEIAEEIAQNMDFLQSDLRDMPDRHVSVRTIFDETWKRLSVQEQSAFMKMSIFRGGFTREAGQAVTGANLRVLHSLMHKALLQRNDSGRFHIHELLRQYAAERLASSNIEFDTREAHAAYFADFLDQRRNDTNGGRQREVKYEIGVEIDNIRLAWHWAVAEINADYIQKIVYPLYQYFRFTSHYLEARDTFQEAAARLSGQPREIVGVVQAELLCFQGWTCTRSGDIETAETVFRQSYDIYETLGHAPRPGLATDPIHGFGTIALIRGDYAEATRIGKLALARCEARRDSWNRIQALYVLSGSALAQGDFLLARQYATEAIGFLRDYRENWFIAYLHNQLGTIARAMGDYDVAHQHYEASYAVRGAYDDREGMALTLNQLGMVNRLQGDYLQAQRHYEQSHRLYLYLGDKGGLGSVLNGLGMVACALGDTIGAHEYFRQAMNIALDIHYTPLITEVLIGFGELCLKTGKTVEGVALLILVQNQSGIHKEARVRAGQLLASYTADVIEEGCQRAKSLDLSNAIGELMN